MNFSSILALVVGTVLPLIFIPIVIGKPQRVRNGILYYGLTGGIAAAVSIIIFKTLFFQEGISPPTRETLSLTLFISLIEAGLLEECFKNGSYLICFYILAKQIDFQDNKYSYLALGAFIGLGFGILENAFYALALNYKFGVLLSRVYTTIPAHMIMNMIFGFLLSQRVNVLIALAASILFHSLYDFFALPSTLLGGILLRAMLVIGFGFCLWMGKFLLKNSLGKVI